MKICLNCGTQLPDNAHFCEKCGAQLDGEIACPNCGNKIPVGSKFCMHCGAAVQKGAQPARKKSHTGLWIFLFLLFVVLVAGAYVGFNMYQQKMIEQAREEQEALELAIQDSIQQAEYLKQQEDSINEARDANNRVDELQALVGVIYNCRKGGHPNDVVRYYSTDMKAAYNSWENAELEGPQGFLFEKKWEGDCENRMKIRNYQYECVEAQSTSDREATFKVKVTFSIYDSGDEDSFVKDVTHEDVIRFINEYGNWRIDEVTRDGLSVKNRYSNGSSDFGKEVCNNMGM